MLSSANNVLIACAGSGKTTRLVNDALVDRTKRIAIVTYTNNNAREIKARFGEVNSGVPSHVEIMSWFSFLLRECVRPYQCVKYPDQRIESLNFVNQRSAQYVKASDTKRYYFSGGKYIYSDKISQFVVECNKASNGALVSRLKQIYTDIYIDEFQDLAGWDFEVVEMLLRSDIRVTMVGDPRQHIYTTNPGAKNKQFLGANVIQLVSKWVEAGLCAMTMMNHTYRCNSDICAFSNGMWEEYQPMVAKQEYLDDHQGVFLVAPSLVHDYIQEYQPQFLRHDIGANTYGFDAMNFGASKGLEFAHVLIVPTGPIKKYLETGDVKHIEKSKIKLHVAVTRAKLSVAFIHDGPSPLIAQRWHGKHVSLTKSVTPDEAPA